MARIKDGYENLLHPAGWLAGWLLAGWLAAWLASCLLAGWHAGKLSETTPCKTTAARWKSQFHYHMILIFTRNETSIHEKHFPCCTFSYQHGFVDEKHVQRSPRYKKSRCSWDGVYLRTSITLRALCFKPAVNRQPGFRRLGLVELYDPRKAFLDLKHFKIRKFKFFRENLRE